MLSWVVRLVLIAASGIVGLFVAEDSPRFGIYQAMVSLLLVVLVVFVGAVAGALVTFHRPFSPQVRGLRVGA
jgi:hypothetical protein